MFQIGDVSLPITLPALLQLVAQGKASKTSAEKYGRDAMYENAGESPKKVDLENLDLYLNYAAWAYEKADNVKENLKESGFILLKHEFNKDAGKVGFYIAHNPKTKVALVGVKGTDSVEDLMTDCCAAAETHKLERSFVADDNVGWFVKLMGSNVDALTNIICHGGILISGKWLAEELKPFIRDFFVPLGYKIIICGHSLGAGASTLTSLLLRSQIPELIKRDCIKVFAYASPPVLNREAAMASSSFITTIVNNTDIIPRCSLNNVEVLLIVLKEVKKKLQEGGLDCSNISSIKAYLQKLKQGTGGEMLIEPEEAFKILEDAQKTVDLDDPNHLYVGGKVILMFDRYQDRKKIKEQLAEEKEKEAEKGKKSKSGRLNFITRKSSKSTEGVEIEIEIENLESEVPKPPSFCVETEPTTAALRTIELHKAMLFDHMTSAYTERVGAIL